MHAVDLVDAETLHQAVLDHGKRAGTSFFRRLEDDGDGAGEVAGLGEIFGRAKQHGRVAIMAAGMHGARGFGGPGLAGFLQNWESVHIRAKADGAIARKIAPDDADHTCATETGHDFVNAERFQLLRNEGCGVVDII
ncbi:hypothetical protein D3C72_1309820 [compost metagenome]